MPSLLPSQSDAQKYYQYLSAAPPFRRPCTSSRHLGRMHPSCHVPIGMQYSDRNGSPKLVPRKTPSGNEPLVILSGFVGPVQPCSGRVGHLLYLPSNPKKRAAMDPPPPAPSPSCFFFSFFSRRVASSSSASCWNSPPSVCSGPFLSSFSCGLLRSLYPYPSLRHPSSSLLLLFGRRMGIPSYRTSAVIGQ